MKYAEMKSKGEQIDRLCSAIRSANKVKTFGVDYVQLIQKAPYDSISADATNEYPGLLNAIKRAVESWVAVTINDAELMIAELEKDTGEAEWVNVKDRLPEAGQAVWVMEDGPIEGRYKAGSFVTDAGFSRPDWWAPRFIPAPPKESGRV